MGPMGPKQAGGERPASGRNGRRAVAGGGRQQAEEWNTGTGSGKTIWVTTFNHIFRPRVPNRFSGPPGPSKQIGDVFKSIWSVCCTEFVNGNG